MENPNQGARFLIEFLYLGRVLAFRAWGFSGLG